MDHLAPQDASMKRMYSFYGPDFTYDALYWNKGHWKLEEQIEALRTFPPGSPRPTEVPISLLGRKKVN